MVIDKWDPNRSTLHWSLKTLIEEFEKSPLITYNIVRYIGYIAK